MSQLVMMTKTFEELHHVGSFNAEQLNNMGALMEAMLHVFFKSMPHPDSVHCVRHWLWCDVLSACLEFRLLILISVVNS